LESLAELALASVVVSENSLCSGEGMRMCSVLLEVEIWGLERREGRESGKRLARGAPVATSVRSCFDYDGIMTRRRTYAV
jgi:hypothetical protein